MMIKIPSLLVAVMVVGTATLRVNISPQHAHLLSPDEGLVVRCAADTPILVCQVRVADKMYVDLSQGRFSDVSGHSYVGEGLVAGHCGVNLSASVLPDWGSHGLIQCRVLAAGSDWVYAIMSVYRYSYSKFPVTTESRQVVVPPGGDVSHLFRAEEPLTRCDLDHPQLGWRNLIHYPTCGSNADSICYYGQGLGHKECGVTISNITDRSNGFLWFHMETTPGLELNFVQVIVTKPPKTIVMTTDIKRNIEGIMTLHAWCTASSSRPSANITWYLGGKAVKDGSIEFVPDERWVEKHETLPTSQKLTRTLDETDDGQELWCIASHVALPAAISSNKTKIVVSSSPTVDPCKPSPCGEGRRCLSVDSMPLCECVIGYFSSPSDRLCLPECVSNPDCSINETCYNAKCVDPCPGACGLGATCMTINHSPVCSCPQQPLPDSHEIPGSEDSSSSPAPHVPASNSCGPAVMEELRVRLLHMEELHQIQMQAEQARTRVEKENAVAARSRARIEEENVLTARARAKNAEEELEFQRELRRMKLQEIAGLTGTSEQPQVH